MYFLLDFDSTMRRSSCEENDETTRRRSRRKWPFRPCKGEKALAQLASEHDVHVNPIQTWRNPLKDNMVSLFESGADQRKGHDAEVKA